MSSIVTSYAQPITQPLEGLYTSFIQLASQHRDMNGRLRSHRNDLLSNAGFNFQGLGADAFSSLITSYLSTSEKHLQILDDAASTVQSCHSTIMTASNSADGAGLHPGLTQHILSQVTPNQIVEQGSDPIQAVINEMMNTLNDMKNSAGGFFSNLFHLHFSSAFDDLIHIGGDIKQMAGEVMSLLDHISSVLGQWANSVFDAIKKCLPAIESATKNVLNFIAAHWSAIKNDISLIGKLKISKALSDLIKKAKLPLTAVTLLINVLDGKDNTLAKFFGDANGQFLSFIPVLGEIKLVFGLFSEGGQLLGGAQQNLISRWIAGGNSFLAQELGVPGAALAKDAEGLDLGSVFTDLGNAIYDVNPVERSTSGVLSDIFHHPGDLLDPGKLADTAKQDFTIDPGAALSNLKKAGGDASNALVSDFEMGGDIAASAEDDYYAIRGNQVAIASNNQFLEQTWRPKIDSFKKWISAHI